MTRECCQKSEKTRENSWPRAYIGHQQMVHVQSSLEIKEYYVTTRIMSCLRGYL